MIHDVKLKNKSDQTNMPAPFITPRELHQKYPASIEQQAFIVSLRQEIRDILNGKDSRLLLIVGPCSIHDLKGAEEYARKLKILERQVADSFLVIMRTYFEKPRTALGWKGLIHDPLLDGSHQMELGLSLSREFLLKLAELKIGAACEFWTPPPLSTTAISSLGAASGPAPPHPKSTGRSHLTWPCRSPLKTPPTAASKMPSTDAWQRPIPTPT